MKTIDPGVVQQFAKVFCFGKSGFSANEIPAYFAKYEGTIPVVKAGTTKADLFAECLRGLSPSNQRLALYDLCDQPPASSHPMPSVQIRTALLRTLVQADGRSPLSVELSNCTIDGVREQWFTAASRVATSPAGAITAARSLLETTCKTILVETGVTPDGSGDLARLYKQTKEALGFLGAKGTDQNIHRMMGGLSQIVDGLAGLSNQSGDRHGLPKGAKVTNSSFAGLAVHASGTIALFMARIHKESQRGPGESITPPPVARSPG